MTAYLSNVTNLQETDKLRHRKPISYDALDLCKRVDVAGLKLHGCMVGQRCTNCIAP